MTDSKTIIDTLILRFKQLAAAKNWAQFIFLILLLNATSAWAMDETLPTAQEGSSKEYNDAGRSPADSLFLKLNRRVHKLERTYRDLERRPQTGPVGFKEVQAEAEQLFGPLEKMRTEQYNTCNYLYYIVAGVLGEILSKGNDLEKRRGLDLCKQQAQEHLKCFRRACEDLQSYLRTSQAELAAIQKQKAALPTRVSATNACATDETLPITEEDSGEEVSYEGGSPADKLYWKLSRPVHNLEQQYNYGTGNLKSMQLQAEKMIGQLAEVKTEEYNVCNHLYYDVARILGEIMVRRGLDLREEAAHDQIRSWRESIERDQSYLRDKEIKLAALESKISELPPLGNVQPLLPASGSSINAPVVRHIAAPEQVDRGGPSTKSGVKNFFAGLIGSGQARRLRAGEKTPLLQQ